MLTEDPQIAALIAAWSVPSREEISVVLRRYLDGSIDDATVDRLDREFRALLADNDRRAAEDSAFRANGRRYLGQAWKEILSPHERLPSPVELALWLAIITPGYPPPRWLRPREITGTWRQVAPVEATWQLGTDGVFTTTDPMLGRLNASRWCVHLVARRGNLQRDQLWLFDDAPHTAMARTLLILESTENRLRMLRATGDLGEVEYELVRVERAGGSAKGSTDSDPGELLRAAEDAAKQALSATTGVTLEQLERARAKLEFAITAIDGLLEVIPPDTIAPPASAFTSEIGNEMFRNEPGRFERPRLIALRDTYRKQLEDHQLAIARLKAPLTDEDRALAAQWRADREKRMQKVATEGPPPRKLSPDSPIFKKWETDPFPGGPDLAEAPPPAQQAPTSPLDAEQEIAYFLDRLTKGDPRARAVSLNSLAGRPRADERLLAAAEPLLDDRTITLLSIPYTFGEVRWIAAEAVAAIRGSLGRTEAVIIEDVFAPVSTDRAVQIAADAGVPESPKGGIEGVIETLERVAAAGKLPRRRIKREPQS